MPRDMTYSDARNLEQLEEASAAFVMDEEAFRAFYDRNARGLWAYLARVAGDRQTADDLLQETFYRFLRANANHESEAHRRNSLYRIATNLAHDVRRRNLTRPEGNVVEHEVETLSAHVRPEGTADFNRAMAHLKPRERAMLWLAYAEGASHKEIAAVLGLRPASLKLLLFRARRRLALLLGRTESEHATN
jgi:RNA polymerase sigma-70 factor (ECF subfamily)